MAQVKYTEDAKQYMRLSDPNVNLQRELHIAEKGMEEATYRAQRRRWLRNKRSIEKRLT